MVKRHMDQQRANLRSTKPATQLSPTIKNSEEETQDDICPPLTPTPAERTHNIYIHYQPVTGQSYSDQTGRFIQPSSAGNKGMLLIYDYDSNAIIVEPTNIIQAQNSYAHTNSDMPFCCNGAYNPKYRN
jgi:hypothetical protein